MRELRQAIEVKCTVVQSSVPCTGRMFPEVALGRSEELVLTCPKCTKKYILTTRPVIGWRMESVEIKSHGSSGTYDPDFTNKDG
jgi:hypothetical protein